MPIQGPLHELGLTDLLQLIHLSRKTGTLTVRSARSPHAAELRFDRGAVVGARAPGESPRLGQLLVKAGGAAPRQVERALAEQRLSPGRRLGAILVESQGVARSEVERQLRFQVEEAVFDLMRWSEGEFHFEEAPVEDAGPIALRVSTEGLLLEAMRRMDEWSAFSDAPPDTELVPGLVEGDRGDAPVLALQPVEWEVLAAVDGERSLRAIAHQLGRAEFDVAKAVFALISAGVVDLRHRRPAPPAAPAAAPPSPAEMDAQRGEREMRRGEWRRAMEALESAVRHDPLLASAYYSLGMAALRAGELGRAAAALETYLRLAGSTNGKRERAERAMGLVAGLRTLFDEEME